MEETVVVKENNTNLERTQRERWLEEAMAEYKEMDLDGLSAVGLGRTFLDYYLLGLYAPLKSMVPVSELGDVHKFVKDVPSNEVEFYFHFPFCRTEEGKKCTFCHFYKVHVKDKNPLEKAYLSRAKRETLFYKELWGSIKTKSIYFGGGTPSLMSPAGLREITDFLNEHLEIEKGAEKKFEIHANSGKETTMLEEKLQVMKEFGITNIVIDIQTFNEQSLASISRGQASLDNMLKTIEKCQEYGFKHFTTALMVGLPFETPETFAFTLQKVTAIKAIETVNTFLLMFREKDPITQQLKEHPEQFCSEKERDIMNIMARNILSNKGFREGPIYFFNRAQQKSGQQTSKFECENLLGIGPSAFGYLNSKTASMQYFNKPDLREYCNLVDRVKFPIWRGRLMDKSEQARRKILFGLNNCAAISKRQILEKFGFGIDKQFGHYIKALESLGLMANFPDSIHLTKKGLLRAEEATYFLASKEVRQRQKRTLKQDERDDLMRYDYIINLPPKNEEKFEEYAKTFQDAGPAHIFLKTIASN